MPYKVTNVSLEHQHALKRRMSPRIQMEPIVAGKRLQLRQSVVLTDEQYTINKDSLAQCLKDGTVTVESIVPYIPMRMPEPAPEDKIRGAPYEPVYVIESQDLDGSSLPSPSPEPVPPVFPVVTSQSFTQTNNPPPPGGSNYPQRRDDRKRGR